jgi:hypothetical protein
MSNITENKLAALLKNSRAIMNKVEENNFERGHIDPNMLVSEGELVDRPVQTNKMSNVQNVSRVNNTTNYKNLNNSKMPKQIIEAMVNNPIDIPETPFHSFDVTEDLINEVNSNNNNNTSYNEDYDEYVEKPTPTRTSQPKKQVVKERINESSSDIREIVREEISRLLPKIVAEYFDQRVITEQIQVKVGNTLFSGNLKPLPSKQTKK